MERDHRRRVPGICFLTKATLNINVRLVASLCVLLICAHIFVYHNLLWIYEQLISFSDYLLIYALLCSAVSVYERAFN